MAAPRGLSRTVYVGTFAHSKSLEELEVFQAVFVDEHGRIATVEKEASDDRLTAVLAELGWGAVGVHVVRGFGKEQFFFPGFIGADALSLCVKTVAWNLILMVVCFFLFTFQIRIYMQASILMLASLANQHFWTGWINTRSLSKLRSLRCRGLGRCIRA